MIIETLNCWWSSSQDVIFDLSSLIEKQNHAFITLSYIYQSTHSISFSLFALTHFISLPCKIDGKEGQSVNADFWHPVESISHQHRCSKFLMKSRIIWSNYDHNQQSTIKNSRLHLIVCNRNQKFKVASRCM